MGEMEFRAGRSEMVSRADEGGEGGEGGEQPKDPCDVLKHVADEIDEGVASMRGITLKDDEDKSFAKEWDEIEEEAEELSKKIRDAVQAKEDLSEDDEDEDDEESEEDDESEDDDEDDAAGGSEED